MKREFLMLSHRYEPGKTICNGWFVSEKLDGLRCWWDGGISIGIPTENIPWANVEKDDRLLNQQISTGLWSRLGKVIHAPKWWIDTLPRFPLDGELYAGRGKFQLTTSIVKKHKPIDNDWRLIKFAVFDTPPLETVIANGDINVTHFKKKLVNCQSWVDISNYPFEPIPNHVLVSYSGVVRFLESRLNRSEYCYAISQEQLPFQTQASIQRIETKLDEIVSEGGEGVMLRRHDSIWTPVRSHELLKHKPNEVDEATVIYYVWGRETDKGSKLLGLMGALGVRFGNLEFELSGFTDEERILLPRDPSIDFATRFNYPGQRVTSEWISPKFPLASRVSFIYRELTDAGVPREARYFRKPK